VASPHTPERARARAASAKIRDEALAVVVKNLRARREQLELTQRDVAAAMGCKQAFVGNVERGIIPTLSYGAVAVFAHVLDTTIEALATPGKFGEPSPLREYKPRKKRRAGGAKAPRKPSPNGVAKRATKNGATAARQMSGHKPQRSGRQTA
jgi:transcriptional regulator with XRE-family HTH domain